MKKKLLIAGAIFQMTAGNVVAIGDSFTLGQELPSQIFVNNRILATVNGKPISVIDIMKKMDMMFYSQFPQYTSSVEIRHQFYQVNWKRVLQDLIDKELVLADAEEHEIKLTNGDIRQEMETLFGPNIILNLDKVGLTFDEAWKMVRGDLIIRRMVFYRANSKGINKVTPQRVKEAYEQYAKDNVRPDEWHYMVISIRDQDAKRGAEAASFVRQLLVEQGVSYKELPEKLAESPFASATKVSISQDFQHGEKDLSPAYKEVITTLGDGGYSQPIPQKSRNDNSTLFRVFHLKKFTPSGVQPFSEVENQLKEQLLNKAINKETEAYLLKLRRHFNVQEGYNPELSSDDFQPFVLK